MRKLYFPVFAFIILFLIAGCKKEANNLIKKSSNDTSGNIAQDTIGHSLQFYGTTFYGTGVGQNSGTIYKINGDGSGFQELFSFDATSGNQPFGSLCEAPNGKLYGVTQAGGANGGGTIFSFDPKGNVFKKLIDFENNSTDNFVPPGHAALTSLMLASNGKLYGTDAEYIYSIDPAADQITFLHTFDQDIDGLSPVGGKLIEGTNGTLYGTLSLGGIDFGTLYSFNINTNKLVVIHNFSSTDNQGVSPLGGICLATDKFIYGTTDLTSGSNDTSTLYKIDISSAKLTKLHSFNGKNGAVFFTNGIVQGNSAKIYGTVSLDGSNNSGSIFSYDINAGVYKLEHSFGGTGDGAGPNGLIMASNNLLYGTTTGGGKEKGATDGVIYRFNPSNSSYSIIYNFLTITQGSEPEGDLIEYHNY